MFDEALCAEVEGILQHYGLLLSVRNSKTVVEYPTIDCLPGAIL